MLATFKHTQGLSNVSFNKTITVFCPLGNDFYTATVSVSLTPGEVMLDYLDIESYFKELQGSHLIIEDLVAEVYTKFETDFEPKKLTVQVYAENATHFPVTVVKTSE